jgi:hypothetical protein
MPKIGKPAPLTSYQKDGKFISFYGDNHPVYAGNVVKAMASAKNGYPYVVKLFEQEFASLNPSQQVERDAAAKNLFARLDDSFKATIVEINRLTPTIVELVIKSKLAADVDHLIVIGSDRMMEAVKHARFDVLKPYLTKAHHAVGSINSPMQCMMKGTTLNVCAKTLIKTAAKSSLCIRATTKIRIWIKSISRT